MKIIGLAGFARVGKSTAALALPGFTRFAFADALKNDLRVLFGMIGCDLKDPENKEKARGLLVAWGATARAFKPDFWIDRLFEELDRPGVKDRFPLVVLDDCRYANEVSAIESRGGKVIRIERPGFGPANDEEKRSFAEIDEAKSLMVVINDGTIENLVRRVHEVC